MPAPNLGGDGKEEVVGEEALSELSLSQGDQFSVSDLESLVTLQAELDRLHHGDPSSEAQIEIEEEVIKEEEVQEEEEVHEEEILEIQEEEIHEVHEGDIHEGDIHEVIVEEIVTDETDGLETEIISEEVSINEVEIEEEDVSDNSVIISGLNEDVEEVEVQIDELQENDVEKSEDKSPSDSKSEDSQVSTQPMNVIKNAFNFPGQIMKVTVSGGQIVSTKMIGQFSPKMQMVNNSNASNSKSSGTGSNVVHLKPVKKVAVQPKPVSFQTVQGFRTITKAGVKRAASTSIDQSRNQSAKMIINSDLTPQPVQHVLLTSETTTSKTVPITTPSQNIKVVTGVSLPQSIAASPNKSITLVQAKQAGLLGPGKLQQIIPSSPQKSIVVNKIGTSPKKVTLMKSPSKILPAPGPQAKGKIAMQKIFLRQGNALKPATFLAPGQQVIRLQNPQNMVPSGVSNVGTLHQIQLPGSKQVQLVRVVGAGNSTATLVPNSSVNQTTVVSVTTALSTASPSEVKTFPVTILPAPSTSISPTSSNSSGSNILTINASSSSNITTVSSSTSIGSKPPLRPKIVSIAPARSTGSGSLLYTVPSPSGTVTPVSSGKSVNVVMLPTQYIQQVQQDSKSNLNAVSISSKFEKLDKPEVTKEMLRDIKLEIKTEHDEKPNLKSKGSLITASQANGIRPRKPCNCTRSQCLKLYCDCFASGEFCYQCNCTCCFNNLEHEEDRQLAIKSCLERNPNAFRPKIGRTYATDTERRHTKGCNCKRSGCLKNYCECYEAKIPCSHNCKCVGCRNIEDGPIAIRRHREELREEMAAQSLTTLATIADDLSSTSCPGQPSKLSMNMFSTDVLEATVQCLLAQALEAQDKGLDKVKSQQLLLEEYGRCLKNIIEFSSMNQDLT